jgi:hypothetical protein
MTYKPTTVYIIHSLQSHYQHDNTATFSNDEDLRADYDTKGIAFYGQAIRSTEMWNVDPDNFRMSALRITAQHEQVILQSNFST